MKAETIGYITGMINSYERTINQYKKDELPKEKYKNFDLVKEELTDLLDFVQDIPEEKHEPVVIDNSEKVGNIKDYIEEIEKSNKDLRLDNISWQKTCNELKEKNEYQEESLETYEANRQAFEVIANKYKKWEESK